MSLSYLEPFKRFCDIKALTEIKEQRDKRRTVPSALKYEDILKSLPQIKPTKIDFNSNEVLIGTESNLLEDQKALIKKACNDLIPWRKGPFNLFDVKIDGEWRSDFKWERILNHLDDMEDKDILDIGCNNGYFLFRMAASNPRLALGIDPMLHYGIQFELMQHFAQIPSLHFELFGVENIPLFNNMFHMIFSMGIIYHHKNPIPQLIDMRNALKPGGQLILETIGIPGNEPVALFPEDRYAKMRNIWFIPTLSCMINWAHKAKFTDIKVISDTSLTITEQRATPWCPDNHQSLSDFLDPNDRSKTIEGHPAPRRFCISARKSKTKKY